MPKTLRTLKHVKEFREAARGSELERDTKQEALERKLTGTADKDWWAAVTKLCGLYAAGGTGPSADEIGALYDWVAKHSTQGSQPQAVAELLSSLHFQVGAGQTGALERARVDAWLSEVTTRFGLSTFSHRNAFVIELTKLGCKKKHLKLLWSTLGTALSKETLAGLRAPTFPAWLPAAILHADAVKTEPFWMTKAFIDAPALGVVAAALYTPPAWQPTTADDTARCLALNAYARGLHGHTVDECRRFVAMFSCDQWATMTAAWKALQSDGKKKALRRLVLDVRAQIASGETRKAVASNTDVSATDKDLGEWLVNYRELVLELLHLGYSAAVVAAMYRHGLSHREMLQLTWFRGTPVVPDNASVSVKPGEMRNGKLEPVHGFIFPHTDHLARRHLYENFEFDAQAAYPGDEPIKPENSFHARGTTLAHLGQMTATLVVPKDQTSYDYPNPVSGGTLRVAYSANRVKTLFPVIAQTHLDYFAGPRLQRMKLVASRFAQPYRNSLPEIVWRAAPRPDLA
jgi:hypothetical protein